MELLWQIILAVLVILVTSLVALKVYVERIKGWCQSKADLTGKTVLITGANIGIGFWTAKDIARRNARVILACRNQQKGQAALESIVSETGNKNVVLMQLDVSLMKSIREFVKQFLAEEDRLDILINNAGMAGTPPALTEEGLETMYATNHYGPFLLTNLLLDLLKKSQPSRIVNLSSMAHRWCKTMDVKDLGTTTDLSIKDSYFSTKLANILFTRELAKRLQGTAVTTSSVHPGVVDSEIWRNKTGFEFIILFLLRKLYFKTSEEGAQTSIYCAVSEDLEGATGHYYMDCREAEDQASDLSKDMELAKRLWEQSEKATGMSKE